MFKLIASQDTDLLTAAHAEWLAGPYARAAAKIKPRLPRYETAGGIPIDPLYVPTGLTPDAVEIYRRDIGFPGESPFTRGGQATMYRGKEWTTRQYAGFGTARESNERYQYLLGKGQTGLSVAFDLPTQMGHDSDAPKALGEVGRTGVAIDSLADMEVLLDKLPLDKITTSMTINSTAAILLCLYIAVADKRGIPRNKLGGTIQNDILKEYMARGTYIYPPGPSMRLVADTFAFAAKEVPNWNTISISGYHIREAGSTAVQEVAFTLADGIAYVQRAIDAGLPVDLFAPRIAFFFNAHNDIMEEVAKFRAARRLWARIMEERFGAKDARSMMLRFHAQTGGSTLTAQQPLLNIARVTMQALSAVMGGAQSVHTNGFDEALAIPTEESAGIALRTQQIILHETGIASFIDPLGGSYALEHLTHEIERRALEYIRRIDERGGMVKAIEAGFPQGEISRAAYEHQRALERREIIVVGVNKFVEEGQTPPATHKLKPELEREQAVRVQRVRAERDQGEVDGCLRALRAAAESTDNLPPHILAAVKANATVGEISNVLREVFGEYRAPVVL